MSAQRKSSGFTLVELLVVISIIAILSVIGITVFTGVQKGARDAKRRGDMNAIAKALEIYKSQNNTYSPADSFPCEVGFNFSFSAWNFGTINSNPGWPGSSPSCPRNLGKAWSAYFANGVPHDPFCEGNKCADGSDSGATVEKDYFFDTTDGSSFTVSAKLENPPNPAMTVCHAGYNYCIKNQQ